MASRAALSVLLTSFSVCLPHPHGSALCPSTDVLLQEGSSKILVPKIASHPNMLYLRKMNESASTWHDILYISKGHMDFLDPEYEDYFHISSNNSLAVTNASGLLNGHYEVVYSINSSCMHQIFLKIPVSKGNQDMSPPWIWVVQSIGVAAIILPLIVVARCLWRRWRRGSDGNEQFQRAPRDENGSPLCLRNGIQMGNLDQVAKTKNNGIQMDSLDQVEWKNDTLEQGTVNFKNFAL